MPPRSSLLAPRLLGRDEVLQQLVLLLGRVGQIGFPAREPVFAVPLLHQRHEIGVVLGLVGASSGMLICFVIPCACFVSLESRWSAARVGALLTLVLSLALLPFAVAIQFL